MLRSLGAQIAHALAQRGVDVVFGIPGVHNIELYRGIEDAGIRHVLPRHEQGAGFMAIGYACVTGRPGVAFVISGPGLCNIMTPMGQAYSDSVPMLVLSSCLDPDDDSSRSRLHEMKDQEGAAATVCDWSATAHDADGVRKLLDRAFAEFSSSRPLPKQIQIPISNLSDVVSPIPDLDSVPGPTAISNDDVEAVAARIGRSRLPLFIFGGGARGASAAAQRVIERSGAAFFCTYAAKGIVRSNHVLGLGTALPRPESQVVLSEADLVVVVGSRLSETDLWRRHLGHRCEMIRIDIDHSALSDKHGADVALHGDATRFLEDLADTLPVTDRRSGWDPAHLRKTRSQFRAYADLERPGIARVADALVDAVGDETVIFSDMTQFAYVAKETVCLDVPKQVVSPVRIRHPGFCPSRGNRCKRRSGTQECRCHRRRLRISVHLAGTGNRRRIGHRTASRDLGQSGVERDRGLHDSGPDRTDCGRGARTGSRTSGASLSGRLCASIMPVGVGKSGSPRFFRASSDRDSPDARDFSIVKDPRTDARNRQRLRGNRSPGRPGRPQHSRPQFVSDDRDQIDRLTGLK